MATARRKPPAAPPLKGRLTLETPLGAVLSESRIRLLEAIDRVGSLNRAAREVPLSYKAAWDALDQMNQLAPAPLVARSTGGAGGGGTRLTEAARQLIALYRAMESSQQDVLDRLQDVPPDSDTAELRTLIRRMTMRSSARNQFAAEVLSLSDTGGRVDVCLGLAPGLSLVASITPESARGMGLAPGSPLFALIKAPWVSVSATPPRRRADRNALPGTVQSLQPGSAHTGVSLALAGGTLLHANMPSAQAAGLQPGQPAWGLFDTQSVVLVSFA